MESVILLIHLILAVAIIGLVLLQRSEGGGLGIGGGGGLGAFASAQSTATALSRITAICAACFFTTSLVLGIMAGAHSGGKSSLMDSLENMPAAASAEQTEDSAAGKPEPEIPSAPVAE